MKYGLAKIASDHLQDPEWNRLNDEYGDAIYAQNATRNNLSIAQKYDKGAKRAENIGTIAGGISGAAGGAILSNLIGDDTLRGRFAGPVGALTGLVSGTVIGHKAGQAGFDKRRPEYRDNFNQATERYEEAKGNLNQFKQENDY